ncbi:MAG: glycoside hydrolase family 3 protein, partial [Treponema sp.]|nr:glycoside hydrolase family 3 protein [Treponema sp.]
PRDMADAPKEQRSQTEQERAVRHEAEARAAAVAAFVDSLSVHEQVCQLFIVNVAGNTDFTPVESYDGAPLIPGGYLFFSYNIADTPEKIIAFTDSIAAFCAAHEAVMPFLAIDHEGGTVNRLRQVVSPFPAAGAVAERLSVSDAGALFAFQAEQLRALGFTMNIAPVVEVRTDDNRAFLGTRSFGNEDAVRAYGTAAITAFQNHGVAAVIKHFPGNTNVDPHTGLPEIALSESELETRVLAPFCDLLACRPAGIVMSHARTKAVDAGVPACLSSVWVNDTVRDSFGYGGLILSDDIFMAALQDNGYPPAVAAVRAIEAGVDCIMISEKRFLDSVTVLVEKAEEDAAFAERIQESCRRVLAAKAAYGVIAVVPAADGFTVCGTAPHDPVYERLSAFKRAYTENAALIERTFFRGDDHRALAR